MNFIELFSASYDSALVYSPNIFFVVMPIVAVVSLVYAISLLSMVCFIVYGACAGVYSNKNVLKTSILKKYGNVALFSYTLFRKISLRVSKWVSAIKKEIFINPKDL